MKKFWKFLIIQGSLWMDIDDIPEIVGPKETLEAWLHTDVGDYHGFLKVIDDVLAGNIEENYLGGNGCNLTVRYDFSEIHFNFEDVDSSAKPCTVPTKLLREIVKAWLDEYEKFRASKKK